jgi:hypothetical protein
MRKLNPQNEETKMVTKQHYPNYVGSGKPINTSGLRLSNNPGTAASYGKGLSSGGSAKSWIEPVHVGGGPVASKRPPGGPKDGAHPNATVRGKGGGPKV